MVLLCRDTLAEDKRCSDQIVREDSCSSRMIGDCLTEWTEREERAKRQALLYSLYCTGITVILLPVV